MTNYLETIADLLPNEQLLNFYKGTPRIPDWLPQQLSLIMGAGDLDQNGLNVDQFSMFDVFYCEPWDNHGSLRRNVEQLLTSYKKKKIICFLNHYSPAHRKAFVDLFKGRFKYIDGYGGHTPHFEVHELEQLLVPGGEAVNIDEPSESAVDEMKLYTLLYTTPRLEPLTYKEVVSIRGPLLLWSNTDKQQLNIYKLIIFGKMFAEFQKPKIRFLGSYADIDEMGPEIALKTMIDKYYLHKKYEPILPDTMKAEIKPFQRPWQTQPFMNFVLTKVGTQGGSLFLVKKSKSKKSRKSKKSKTRRYTH